MSPLAFGEARGRQDDLCQPSTSHYRLGSPFGDTIPSKDSGLAPGGPLEGVATPPQTSLPANVEPRLPQRIRSVPRGRPSAAFPSARLSAWFRMPWSQSLGRGSASGCKQRKLREQCDLRRGPRAPVDFLPGGLSPPPFSLLVNW